MRLAVLFLAACSSADAQPDPPDADVGCPPVMLTTGSSPRDVVVENGVARVTYPQLMSGIDQLGSHQLEIRVDGAWVPALEPWYADWTFYAAPFWAPAHASHVLTNTPDLVEVAFEFDHWLDYPGGYTTLGHTPRWWNEAERGPCTPEAGCRCYLPGCGVHARDWLGEPVYVHNLADAVKQIRRVRFWKVIGMRRCESGYRIGYHSDPPLMWGSWIEGQPTENSYSEREFGSTGHRVIFDVTGEAVHHPVNVPILDHWMPVLYQTHGPWWVAALRAEAPFVHVVSLEHPLKVAARQWSSNTWGTLTVHFVNPEIEADGRVGRYQVALHAFRYVSPDPAAEPTPTLRALVENHLATW